MKKQKLTKLITIGTVITSIVTIINLGFKHLLPLYMSSKLIIEKGRSNSIGIIGGADGPTVIFLSGQFSSNFTIIVFALLSIAGIIYLIFNKKAIK